MRYLIILLFFIVSCTTPTQPDYQIESKFLHYSNTVPEASRLALFQEISTGHKFLVNISGCEFPTGWQGILELNDSEQPYLILQKCPTLRQ